ncbi:MAG: MlaD family protein [Muribaculaceae bacterium]|nr:MlaD family protein [Muribaculaceae bacterium]
MKKIITKEFIIGLSVILAVLILFFGIEYLKGINLFKPANYYVASYGNVAGLETAAPVQIDGYKVGQVRDIKFNYANPGKIDVVLALNKSLRIPEDSKAIISTTLLSGAYVEIKLGKSSKFAEVGSTIEGMVMPDMMASISDNLLPGVANILPRVDSLLASLNTLASDPALLKSIQRLDGISDNLSQATVGLNSMMRKDVPAIMGNAGRVASNLDTITRNLGELSYQLKRLPLDATVDNVNDLTGNLAKFSEQLNNPNSSLGMLMNDPEFYQRLNKVSADIDSLIIDIQKNPKRYISIKLL